MRRANLKLGEVLQKEREARGLAAAQVSASLGIPENEYRALEQGTSGAEKWGPLLANIATYLQVPVSRLISESGKAVDAIQGQCGARISAQRQQRRQSSESVASSLEIPMDEYLAIEAGGSPVEKWGPLLLRLAEIIEQPVFDLFYPCGIAIEKLESYP